MSPVNIGVLISGGGTNLQSLIDGINSNKINGQIKAVISSRKNAYGLERAKNNGIEAFHVNSKQFEDNIEFNREIMRIFKEKDVELIILAGYLKILSKELVREYKNRVMNIHPALIPSFCGKGFYGQRVHEAVLEYGAKITGATVHFADEGTDTGPIILQKAIKVHEDDTVETLQKRVLQVEHEILCEAVGLYCAGKLEVIGRRVKVMEG